MYHSSLCLDQYTLLAQSMPFSNIHTIYTITKNNNNKNECLSLQPPLSLLHTYFSAFDQFSLGLISKSSFLCFLGLGLQHPTFPFRDLGPLDEDYGCWQALDHTCDLVRSFRRLENPETVGMSQQIQKHHLLPLGEFILSKSNNLGIENTGTLVFLF